MSEIILNQILDKLNQVDNRMNSIDERLASLEIQSASLDKRVEGLENTVKSIKADTADIPLIRRAVLETNDAVRQISGSQKSFEKKVLSDLNTHDYSIDILNRRQLKVEAEFESFKNS